MITIIKSEQPRLPHLLGGLAHANQYLKAFSVATMAMAALSLGIVLVLVSRPPMVLTLTPSGVPLKSTALPAPEDEINVGVREYLGSRYQWEPGNVREHLGAAQAFILPANLKAYQSAVVNIARFALEKQVSQRVYPEKLEISIEKKTVQITGDRITTAQGLKAAGVLRLELSFESGPRTKENPWGIYITKEKEM